MMAIDVGQLGPQLVELALRLEVAGGLPGMEGRVLGEDGDGRLVGPGLGQGRGSLLSLGPRSGQARLSRTKASSRIGAPSTHRRPMNPISFVAANVSSRRRTSIPSSSAPVV